MDAASISKFPIDQFPVELRIKVYEMSDPFDTFCTKNEIPWFANKSGCPYKKIPWARTILLSSVLNDKDALELASIQTEYRKVKFSEHTMMHIIREYYICGDFPRAIFCELIALGGNLQALKWARTYRNASMVPKNPSGNRVYRRPFPWTSRVCYNAAKGGHVEILKWAVQQGTPLDKATFAMVAEFGDIQMLKWLREKGCPSNERTLYSAAFGGHLEILKWLHTGKFCCSDSFAWSGATAGAAETGQLAVLMWLQEKNYPMHMDVMFLAAKNGHFHVVQWLHDLMFDDESFRVHTYPDLCYTVARTGRLDLLQWLHERGYEWDKSTTYQAKKWGHSEMFEWAISHGCPYDADYTENSDTEESDSEGDDDEDEDVRNYYSEYDDREQGDSYDDNDEFEDEVEDFSEDDDMGQGDSDEYDDEVEDEDEAEVGEVVGASDEEIIATSKRRRQW